MMAAIRCEKTYRCCMFKSDKLIATGFGIFNADADGVVQVAAHFWVSW